MNKPHWELLHCWWVEDFEFWCKEKKFFILMARKYPGDTSWHAIIKTLEGNLRREQKRYKEIYGVRFNLNRVKGVKI